jgi:hypothetical protein
VVGYDAAKQHRALATELRAAREVVDRLPGVGRLLALADWMDMDDEAHGRVGDEVQNELRAVADALLTYDATPKAVLDHQPEPSKETT